MTILQTATSSDGLKKALRDATGGVAMWELWLVLGWNDIRQRYRRSLLGPFWLTLSMGVMIGTIGYVYAKLFNQPTTEYLPYLTLGFIVWAFISGIVLELLHRFHRLRRHHPAGARALQRPRFSDALAAHHRLRA